MLEDFGNHIYSFEILRILAKKKNTFRNELLYSLHVDKDAGARTLTFLRELSLIEDEPAPPDKDGRKRWIHLTSRGEKVARAILEIDAALRGR